MKKKEATQRGLHAQIKRAFAEVNANAHLRAYTLDRNPDHVFNALREFTRHGLAIEGVMLKNLARAIAERHKKPTGKAKSTTLRDVYVAAFLARRYGGTIPARVDAEYVATLAKTHRTTPAAIKMSITRIRRALQDPHYNRARAFS